MRILTAEFVSSHSKPAKLPTDGRPEFAFIGRSNVGKSSLINMLCERKDMAKTSSTPGKTALINYFLINDSWYLVDLPGYGYAKVAQKTRVKWHDRSNTYLLHRGTLVNTFVLIDSNVPPQAIDLDFCNFMGENHLPFALTFTKTDRKKGRDGQEERIEAFSAALLETFSELPPIFRTSAVSGDGREEVLAFIGETLERVGWKV